MKLMFVRQMHHIPRAPQQWTTQLQATSGKVLANSIGRYLLLCFLTLVFEKEFKLSHWQYIWKKLWSGLNSSKLQRDDNLLVQLSQHVVASCAIWHVWLLRQ